jgi:hypothetical protein
MSGRSRSGGKNKSWFKGSFYGISKQLLKNEGIGHTLV